MTELQIKVISDTWTPATWDEYLKTIDQPELEKAKGYYYKGHMRIEMAAVEVSHASDHSLIIFAVSLFATLKGVPFKSLDNCTYRKPSVCECQPDVSYYVADRARLIPKGTGIADLNRYAVPDLAIEVAMTSLLDDLGTKRALYEELGIAEYWIVDVKNAQILAYQIGDRGSHRIDTSIILPGLASTSPCARGIAVLEEALRRSRDTDQSEVGAWLMTQFQS